MTAKSIPEPAVTLGGKQGTAQVGKANRREKGDVGREKCQWQHTEMNPWGRGCAGRRQWGDAWRNTDNIHVPALLWIQQEKTQRLPEEHFTPLRPHGRAATASHLSL